MVEEEEDPHQKSLNTASNFEEVFLGRTKDIIYDGIAEATYLNVVFPALDRVLLFHHCNFDLALMITSSKAMDSEMPLLRGSPR